MNILNNFKEWITTLIGVGFMGLSGYGYIVDWFDIWPAGTGIFIAGFALLFMKDALILNIGKLFGALINKISGNQPPPQ